MSEKTFEAVFKGRIVTGAEPSRVKSNLARLFKTDATRIEAMFSGKRVVIKRGVDEATARNYQAALRKAGAIVEVVNTAAPPVARIPVPAEPPAPSLSMAEVGVTLVEPKEIQEPDIDTSDLSVAEPGVTLVEPREIPEPDIDTSDLSVAEPGVTLVEPREVEAPEYDLSDLEMAPPGTRLSDQED